MPRLQSEPSGTSGLRLLPTINSAKEFKGSESHSIIGTRNDRTLPLKHSAVTVSIDDIRS